MVQSSLIEQSFEDAGLRTPNRAGFRLVKDALVVGLLCARLVVNDSGQFVGGCCDRLGSAMPPRDPPEEFSKIIFSVMQCLCAHAQGGRYTTPHASAIGEKHFATTGIFPRAKP